MAQLGASEQLDEVTAGLCRGQRDSMAMVQGDLAEYSVRGTPSQTLSTTPPRVKIPADLKPWFEARQRFRLSHASVQMARELGLNPRKFDSLADVRGAPWKLPLPAFIAECYYKAHGRREPEHVRSLEQVISDKLAKKAQRRERKALRAGGEGAGSSEVQP